MSLNNLAEVARLRGDFGSSRPALRGLCQGVNYGYIKSVSLGEPTLEHLNAWTKELDAAGIDGRVSPMLLPDNTRHA